jgi:hypothetical protein
MYPGIVTFQAALSKISTSGTIRKNPVLSPWNEFGTCP